MEYKIELLKSEKSRMEEIEKELSELEKEG